MTKIVFMDRDTIGPSVEITRPGFDHEWIEYARTSPEQVAGRLRGADIAITNKTPIRRETFEQCPRLKFIAIAATGYDVIDIEAARQHGVTVSNIRNYAVNTVPEHTFALIMALRRSLIGFRADVIAGEWQRSGQFCFFNHPIRDLAGSKLGIFGEGALGQAVAEIAKAFGMQPMFAAHKGVAGLGPLYTPFDEVLETADIITLHAPLMPSTRNMIALPEFKKMKRRPIIVNTARGGLVDEAALVRALDEGLISGIGFDVLTREPPAADNPLLTILDRPNVIVTPHIAWASEQAMQQLWLQLIEHLEAFHRGAPTNVIS